MPRSSTRDKPLGYSGHPTTADLHEMPFWQGLTRNPEKRRLYSSDSRFLEGQAMLEDIVGADWQSHLHHTAMVLFKPESVVGRRLSTAISYFESRGLLIVDFATPVLDVGLTHELWRYQLNFATVDRIVLQTRIRPATRTLAILLRSRIDHPRPLTVELKAMKGAAVPTARARGSLRDMLGSTTALLNFVHTPDEPADLVRELAILADGMELGLNVLCHEPVSQLRIEQVISELYEAAPAHDLDCVAARLRTHDRLRALPGGSKAAFQFGKASAEQPLALRELLSSLATAGIYWPDWQLDARWDLVIGAADVIDRDRTNVAALLNDSQMDPW